VGEISWVHIKHPADLLSEGQQVDVKVIGLDPEKKKISLGMRQLSQNPWNLAADKYAAGSTHQGTVTRTTNFGAFIELEPGVEGLVHISELEHRRVNRVTDVLKVGQQVDAKVLEVDLERKRIALSLKALVEKPQEKREEQPAPVPAIERKRKSPLKGGMGDSGGGKLFGNPRDFR
jgi:small subunit ribosomal protein S1